MACVMAVNLILRPDNAHIPFAISGMTSATGKCHTFDVLADGYVRAEACGAAVLQAAANEAEIMAVLDGTAVSCDGKSASLTAPNGQAQRQVILAALAVAQVGPAMVHVAEAAANGTMLGDPIEMGSLSAVVLKDRSSSDSLLAVGSMKANVGHSEPGAGFSGLLKLMIGLTHRGFAPNAQLHILNPHVSSAMDGARCALPTQRGTISSGARIGCVSSFGYRTIAHAVLRNKSDVIRTIAICRSPLQYRRRTLHGVGIGRPSSAPNLTTRLPSHSQGEYKSTAIADASDQAKSSRVTCLSSQRNGLSMSRHLWCRL